MDDKESKVIETYIPDNILDSKRIMGFRKQNVIEGLVLAAIVALIILQIPFVKRIKIIFIIILCLVTFVLSCIGIKDKRISEIVINFIQYIKLPKVYHLRSIKNARKKKKQSAKSENIYANQSAAEKCYAFIKNAVAEYKSNKQNK